MKKIIRMSLLTLVFIFWNNPISASCDLNGFTTFTQGGWGSPGNSTPGGIRDAYFSQVFPSGMTIGGNYKALFTSASAIQNYLPAGETAGIFTQNYTNPTTTSAGVFGGQVAALSLNVAFSDAGYIGTNPVKLGQLVIITGPLAGKSVYQLLDYCNTAIGGGTTPYTIDQLNTAADNLNNNFDNGTQDLGFLACPNGSIGDFVWNDLNHNGIQDAGEAGIPSVVVNLYTCANVLVSSTTTGADGSYLFENVSPGDYYLRFNLPSGYVFSPKLQGNNQAKDSDPDPATSKTACFTMLAGESNLTKDAGMYLPNGSIGDFVWNDLNKDGIQDNGEAGIGDVTVKLYNCSDVLVATTTTASNGSYLFDDIAAGSYYVKFVLPSGYTFSPALQGTDNSKDSDADISTGKTSCFTLAVGENNLTKDAGMYVPASTKPQLSLSKTDGIVFMKAIGENDTYAISYKNTGNANLLNGVIVDTLPAGLDYVSCSGATACSETSENSNIVNFTIGTVAPGDSGVVYVTAAVTDYHPNYTNYAYFSGNDSEGDFYWTNAEDVDIADTTSSGGGGGAESKGDLAEQLLLRQLKIRYGMTTPILSDNGKASITSQHTLQELVQLNGPFSSTGVEVTPFDILGISNAISAYAVDYRIPVNSVNKTIAAVFSTITAAPYIYDHTKAVCDRLSGSELQEIKLTTINGHQFYCGKLYNPATKQTDYSISFSVYETPTGYKVESKWTYGEYIAPQNAAFVYNFQIWSGASASSVQLVESVLSKFNSFGSLSYMNNNQNTPDMFVEKADYKHLGKVSVTVTNNSTSAKDVTFNVKYKVAQGSDVYSTPKNYTIQPGTSEITMNTGIISDANISILQSGSFSDEVYVSGGSYASIAGPQSTVNQFVTNTYPQQSIGNYPDGSAVLAGGARINGVLNDWVSVIRSLTPAGSAYDLTGHNRIRLTGNGTGVLTILIDMTTTQGFNYHAYNIPLTGNDQVYEINFDSFHELWGTTHVPVDPSKIRMIGFQLLKTNNTDLTNFSFEVKDIVFVPTSFTGINDIKEVPKEFSLSQNYPNPFNPSTVIEFSAAKREALNLTIYNILGQKVMTLIDGEVEAGVHRVNFNGSQLASGMYIYRLTGSSINVSKKMLLIK